MYITNKYYHNMSNISVCLCITNYKKEVFLDRAIRSCKSQLQQFFNIEIILVNDGSKNFHYSWYKQEHPEIDIINLKTNKGVSYATNKALFKTKCKYFMRVDGDDYLSIKACLILISFLEENNSFPFIYGDLISINHSGVTKELNRNDISKLLEYGAGVMFRTHILKKIGGYDTKLKNCEDFDLICRVIKKYGYGFHIPIKYYRYYKTKKFHLTNTTSRKKLLKKMRDKYKLILKNFENDK